MQVIITHKMNFFREPMILLGYVRVFVKRQKFVK